MTRCAFGFLFCLFSCLASFAADSPERQYSIKEETPRTGTLIKRDVLKPTKIPINLSYEQLSVAERERFHNNYEAIALGDEPPFPIGGLKVVYDPITKAYQRSWAQGRMLLSAVVSASGEAIEVKVYETPDKDLHEFVAKVLTVTRFKPAICSGTPCQMEFPLRMQFAKD